MVFMFYIPYVRGPISGFDIHFHWPLYSSIHTVHFLIIEALWYNYIM